RRIPPPWLDWPQLLDRTHPTQQYPVVDSQPRASEGCARLQRAETVRRRVARRIASVVRAGKCLGAVLPEVQAVPPGERGIWRQVEAAPEKVRDQERPRPRGPQTLGRLEPWGECGDIEVDRHRHKPVRLDDASHV